jgi:hypothetical protein
VVDERWCMNCKVDGSGPFLYDLATEEPYERNVAADNGAVVDELYARALEDAGGRYPDYLVAQARGQTDAPGCSELAARASCKTGRPVAVRPGLG